MNLRSIIEQEILPRVEKSSRYLGNELNTVHKNPDEVDFRFCLFFPDLYELGLGNLGLHILYAILNDMDGVWAERGYSPAPDLEALLRERNLPLFLYESKDPLSKADVIGFTLQSELTFTNILNALDLAGLAVRSEQRADTDPLVIAGGPAVFNPEPLAPFMDAFLIGDGEEAVVDLVRVLRPLKNAPRREKLEAIAAIDGFYVPALYPFETMADGQILPEEDAPKIVKRLVRDLDAAKYPTKYIVPFTELVHDGVGLEVLRGCTQGCRFCQAGMVTRPVRERSLEEVDRLMAETLDNTGLEAVTLVSLSTCDFSRPRTLVKQAAQRAKTDNVSVSLPSLRLDSFAVEMADMVSDVRRSGLTFAPEAATPRLRAVINKFIPDEELLTMATEAFRRGWTSVKTYFMIGLPTERDEDVLAIADLCIRTLKMGRKIRPGAMVRTGVSTFVPKPFTPFQWAPQIDIEETRRRQALLSDQFRRERGIRFGRHNAHTSFIEGLLSRADRRAADLIEAAWRDGARLESWDEHVDIAHWEKAIEATGFDVAVQFRERDVHERLPWDHIDVMIPKQWLQEDWERARALEHAPDCRADKCHRCGVIDVEPRLCGAMLKRSRRGRRQEEATWDGVPEKTVEHPPPAQRIQFRIGRLGEARFLGHLELKNLWIRALRRAKAPIAYTQGFHAQPRVAFSTAVPVGEESVGDHMDVVLTKVVPPVELFDRLAATLPLDFRVFDAIEVSLRAPALMGLVEGFVYSLYGDLSAETAQERIDVLLAEDVVLADRKAKANRKHSRKKKRGSHREIIQVDIRPMIAELALRDVDDEGRVEIHFVTRMHENRLAKPRDIMAHLGLDPNTTRILKRETLFRGEAKRK